MPLQDINQGTPKDTYVLLGKRSMRAKDNRLLLATIGWSKAQLSGPRGILCTRGEKEHTSKRVSIIACNNVISKTKCATCARGSAAEPPVTSLNELFFSKKTAFSGGFGFVSAQYNLRFFRFEKVRRCLKTI